MLKLLILSALLFFQSISTASTVVEPFQIYRGGVNKLASLDEALAEIKPGDVLFLGESHGNEVMPRQQLQILQALRGLGFQVSVGMEFFERQIQGSVDAMRSGALSEEGFLQKIGWGNMPYSSYRQQVLFPKYPEEYVVALNAPRTLTSKISKVGIQGLDEFEKSQLPWDFMIGNQAYFRRFKQVMGEHISVEALGRYFEAQSVWDDVMAFETVKFMKSHPEQVLVIIVGEFHVQYGGGFPDRLRNRMKGQEMDLSRITTFSLINLEGMSQDEREQAVRPSLEDGPRADYVWTSQF